MRYSCVICFFVYYLFTLLRTNYSPCLYWISNNYSFIFMDSLAMFMLGFLLLCKSRSNTFQPGGFRFRFSLGFRYSFRFGLSVVFGGYQAVACRFKNTFICMIWQFFKAIDLPQLVKTGRKKNIMARCGSCGRCYLANIWNCLKKY